MSKETSKITPKGFTVLVDPKPIEEEYKTTNSGIVIPETVKDKQRINVHVGTVVQLGNCAFADLGDGTPWCKQGDTIIYAQFGGKFVKDGSKEYVLIQDKDVMAVVEE